MLIIMVAILVGIMALIFRVIDEKDQPTVGIVSMIIMLILVLALY